MNPTAQTTTFWRGAVVLLILLVVAVYLNSFAGGYVFDDVPSVVNNTTIRSFATALHPPGGGTTVSGRPFLNLTFAFNYAVGGLATRGYHATNLLIHVLAALTLFGLIRRTLLLPGATPRLQTDAHWLAWWIALLWAIHPLQVESVTYIVQRAESLAALFGLLTIYTFVRSADSERRACWQMCSVFACLLAAATKETAAPIPLLVLLYDRGFITGSFVGAWRRHRGIYVGLATSWVVALLVLAGDSRGGTAGLHTPAKAWEYACLQMPAVLRYLRTALWPHPLVFDYGPFQAVDWTETLLSAPVVIPALVITVWLVWRAPKIALLPAAFFLLLAPSSSVVPITSQIMAEHRMYLPLAAVVATLVLCLHRWTSPRYFWAIAAGVSAATACITWQRNQLYKSPQQLWTETVVACPNNPRAHSNLGETLVRAGQPAAAISEFKAALHLQPNFVGALYNLGTVYLAQNRPSDAVPILVKALELSPNLPETAYNLGNAYASLHRFADAAHYYRRAIQLEPSRAKAHFNLANALVELGELPDAVAHYESAARLDPADANAHFNLANALLQSHRASEAIPHYEAVLRLQPADRDATQNLAIARRLAGLTR